MLRFCPSSTATMPSEQHHHYRQLMEGACSAAVANKGLHRALDKVSLLPAAQPPQTPLQGSARRTRHYWLHLLNNHIYYCTTTSITVQPHLLLYNHIYHCTTTYVAVQPHQYNQTQNAMATLTCGAAPANAPPRKCTTPLTSPPCRGATTHDPASCVCKVIRSTCWSVSAKGEAVVLVLTAAMSPATMHPAHACRVTSTRCCRPTANQISPSPNSFHTSNMSAPTI